MVQKLALVAAIVVLLLSRTALLVQGPWSERPENPEAIKAAVARLDRMPLALGPWRGEKLPDLDPETIAEARVAGHVWRRYGNSLTGDAVSVLLVCGPAEPIALHTPEVCYRGIGYHFLGQPNSCTIHHPGNSPPDVFWTARFRKASVAVPEQLRIYWAWQAQRNWEAPESPLRAFASFPVLYKLYVISAARLEGEAPPENDPCREFLDALLPELQKVLSK
jgi:Protein of unknown function (DUF3485)